MVKKRKKATRFTLLKRMPPHKKEGAAGDVPPSFRVSEDEDVVHNEYSLVHGELLDIAHDLNYILTKRERLFCPLEPREESFGHRLAFIQEKITDLRPHIKPELLTFGVDRPRELLDAIRARIPHDAPESTQRECDERIMSIPEFRNDRRAMIIYRCATAGRRAWLKGASGIITPPDAEQLISDMMRTLQYSLSNLYLLGQLVSSARNELLRILRSIKGIILQHRNVLSAMAWLIADLPANVHDVLGLETTLIRARDDCARVIYGIWIDELQKQRVGDFSADLDFIEKVPELLQNTASATSAREMSVRQSRALQAKSRLGALTMEKAFDEMEYHDQHDYIFDFMGVVEPYGARVLPILRKFTEEEATSRTFRLYGKYDHLPYVSRYQAESWVEEFKIPQAEQDPLVLGAVIVDVEIARRIAIEYTSFSEDVLIAVGQLHAMGVIKSEIPPGGYYDELRQKIQIYRDFFIEAPSQRLNWYRVLPILKKIAASHPVSADLLTVTPIVYIWSNERKPLDWRLGTEEERQASPEFRARLAQMIIDEWPGEEEEPGGIPPPLPIAD
jgi:hypothetical protein